ncbi:hypothetical protein JST97_10585 [bacterium]|nr:hypothetical protein [bacterium]
MLNVPASMQPTLDRWKQTNSIGEGMRFSNSGTGSSYAQLMDTVVASDNGPNDANPARGLLVAKDDGETIRFSGDSKNGSLEACTADGGVVALKLSANSIDHLQLTPKNGGVEALHQHFDRNTGEGWMQVGGAVTVINMDEPGALDGIFGLKASAPAPEMSAENAARAEQIGARLAERLKVDAQAVQLRGFDASKGFNAGNCDFAVSGELQMSAFTQGIEARYSCEGQNYIYRGLDEKSGRFGQDVQHEGYWKEDERGIYVPDPNAPSLDGW